MRVFKCALSVLRGNITFLLVYIVGLSFMGVFMAQSFSFENVENALEQEDTSFSIVDRDNSTLSQGLEAFLEGRAISVHVEDSSIAFQDAIAKGQTDYLLVVPQGYEDAFRVAALAGEDAPQMDVIYSYYAADGALIDEVVDAYLSCVRSLMLANTDASMTDIVNKASAAMSEHVDVQIIPTNSGMSEADRFVFYLQWSTYTLFAGIVVCIGLLISTMNRADVRRRNLASPLSYASYNVQLALACAVIAVMSCAWTFILGLAFFPEAAASIAPAGIALCALSVLMYALMALAFGFMLGQFGIGTIMCNAIGNIFGMIISFLGGAWISLDLLSSEVLALAHWLPGYWYTDACQVSAHFGAGMGEAGSAGFAGSALSTVFVDIGILALFALAFLSIGFVVAKRRLQTSEAGGNRAAEAVGVI